MQFSRYVVVNHSLPLCHPIGDLPSSVSLWLLASHLGSTLLLRLDSDLVLLFILLNGDWLPAYMSTYAIVEVRDRVISLENCFFLGLFPQICACKSVIISSIKLIFVQISDHSYCLVRLGLHYLVCVLLNTLLDHWQRIHRWNCLHLYKKFLL